MAATSSSSSRTSARESARSSEESIAALTGFEHACRTNPRAIGGFFVRAYMAWKAGDVQASQRLLFDALEARGDDWKPEGAAAEGDVAVQMHREATPFSRFWERWDGEVNPAAAFAEIDAEVERWKTALDP